MSNELELFRRRLSETRDWCLPRISLENPVGCLRSLEAAIEGVSQLSGLGTPEEHRAIVERLVNERSERLRSSSSTSLSPELSGGRLLCCDPFASLICGGAEQESKGYINLNDIPPCDTWIHYACNQLEPKEWFNDYIVCWVPNQFVDFVEAGIDCAIGWGLKWGEEIDTPLARQLRFIIKS